MTAVADGGREGGGEGISKMSGLGETKKRDTISREYW